MVAIVNMRDKTRILTLVAATALAAVSMRAAPASTLIDAVKSGDRASIQRLLRLKTTDVNASTADGMTALDWAVERGDADTVGLLLRSGADAKTPNRYG